MSMSGDLFSRKANSPQSSTEVSSLQVNRLKNKEALEKRLKCRPPIKELVNQGILPNPYVSHPDKVRQLQRAKTSDLLKHKIEKRPDRQSLVNRRIIREDKPGTSPYINEQCRKLEKCRLKTSLNSKLTARPGSLELIEKGVLQVDPGVDSLVRCGSLQYPRVEIPYCAGEKSVTVAESIPVPPPLPVTKLPRNASTVIMSCVCSSIVTMSTAVTSCAGLQRLATTGKQSAANSSSRSMRDETVISKYGALVFHNYCPKSFDSRNPPVSSSFLEKQRAREAQQADLLRLQDTALAHHLVQKELCELATRRPVNRSDENIMAQSDSPSDPNFTQQSQPQSSLSSYPNSPSQPCNMSLIQSASSFTPLVVAESGSGEQSVKWLTDSPNSLVFMVDKQSDGAGSRSCSTASTLAQLNKTQLRAECRERNLPRSGVKATLIRQLEPHSEEILSKYFSSATPISCDMHDLSPVAHAVSLHPVQSISVSASSGPSARSHSISSVYPQPPPIWTAPNQSTGAVFTVSSPSWPLSTANQTGGIFVCPRPQAVQPVLKATASVNTTPTALLIASQPALPMRSPTELRHSNSAPFFTEMGSTVPVLPSASGNISITPSLHGQLSSVPSTPFIPVQLETANLSTTANSSPYPIGMYLGMVQTPVLSESAGVLSKPTVYLSSSFLSLSQATNLPCRPVSTASSADTSTTSAVSNTCQKLPSVTNDGWLCTHTSSFDAEHQTVSDSDSFLTGPGSVQSTRWTNASDDRASCVELPSLSQVENMWFRIRDLRRVIDKAQESVTTLSEQNASDQSATQIQQLKSEHDRLVTLFRLVVIARIDALSESRDSGIYNSSDDPNTSVPSTTDLQVELKLMQHYLRVLGDGTVATEGALAFGSGPRLRRASSPLLEGKAAVEQRRSMPKPGNLLEAAHIASSGPLTSTPRTESFWSEQTTSRAGPLFTKATFNGSQTAEIHNLQEIPVRVDDLLTPEGSSEPASSPINTDVLFELWDSVAKDNVQSIPTGTQMSDDHCSSLPGNLVHGSGRPPVKVNSHGFQRDSDYIMTQPMSTESLDPPDSQARASQSSSPTLLPRRRCSPSAISGHIKHSNERIHPASLTIAHPLLDGLALPENDSQHSLIQSCTSISDVDWPSLVSSACLFSFHAQNERACADPIYPMNYDSQLPRVVSVSTSTSASHPSPLFQDLMDTGDSTLGLSPMVASWTGDS